MTKSARTRTPSAAMEAALLDAASRILDIEGPEALSVRGIAAAAGVAPMGVYNHFESKSGIIEALFIQGFERLVEATNAVAEIEDPYQALRECARRYRALAVSHPMMYRLMFLRAVPGFEPRDRAINVASAAFSGLVAAVQRAMAARVIVGGPPDEIARVIWASIHGWMALELLGIGPADDQAAGFDRLCRSILAGLGPDAAPHGGGAAASKP